MDKDLKDIFTDDNYTVVSSGKDAKKKKIFIAVTVCACILAMAVCFALGFVLGNNTGINNDMPLLIEAYQYIKEYYYKDISWNEFQELAAAAMAGSLDKFSGMVSVDGGNAQSGSFGVSVTSTAYNQHLVSFITPDTVNYSAIASYKFDEDMQLVSPFDAESESVAMREGDRIFALGINIGAEDEYIVQVESADLSLLSGILNEWSMVQEVTFIFKKYDGSGSYLDGYYGINLKRTYSDALDKKAFYYSYSEDTGIIKLLEFSKEANLDFEKCVEQFVKEGKSKLILDLRNNGGGDATSLQFIAQYLVKNPQDTSLPIMKLVSNSGGGKMASNITYTSKDGGEKESYYLGNVIEGFDIAVLVNGSSASASEALIGALQYYNDTQIVGVNTFGKGVAQRVFTLSNGDLLYVTNGTYYVPTADASGRIVWEKCIHGVGFKPTEENTVTDIVTDYKTDACTARAMEILHG